MNKAINAVYEYVNEAVDPDECKRRLDLMVDFIIRLRHSYVDMDKPMSDHDVNMELLRVAETEGLRVAFVDLEEQMPVLYGFAFGMGIGLAWKVYQGLKS